MLTPSQNDPTAPASQWSVRKVSGDNQTLSLGSSPEPMVVAISSNYDGHTIGPNAGYCRPEVEQPALEGGESFSTDIVEIPVQIEGGDTPVGTARIRIPNNSYGYYSGPNPIVTTVTLQFMQTEEVMGACVFTHSVMVPTNEFTIEKISGDNQSYRGGGMPDPMVIRIKDNKSNTYVNDCRSAGLTIDVTADHQGQYDGEFNNLNDYDKNGDDDATYFGGYYYVPSNRGSNPYTLTVTVRLLRGGGLLATCQFTQSIKG